MKQSKSSRDWSFRIRDILHAINKIELYIKNMTELQFKRNGLVIDAVIRNFEIIGEASNNVPLTVQQSHPHIPWRQMTALRNFLIHEYFWFLTKGAITPTEEEIRQNPRSRSAKLRIIQKI